MKISKFLQKIKLKEDLYAIYNNLVMDIYFVNSDKYKNILKFNVIEKEKKNLINSKIYILDKEDDYLLEKLQKEKEEQIGKIKTMYLCVTSSCNLGCSYCFINNQKNKTNKLLNMDLETALVALEKFSNYLKESNNIGKVVFYGGEPLIKWDIIKKCILETKNKKYPIIFSIITNATLLSEEMINFLKRNKVNVGISIDGPRKLNDKNRKYIIDNKSVYDDVFNKIELLKKHKCDFGLSITISNEILNNQDEIISWLKECGVNNISYNMLHYTWKVSNWEDYYLEATRFICKSYLKNKDCIEGSIQSKINYLLQEKFCFFGCSAIGKRQIVVKPNGDICICHGQFRDDNSTFSNIRDIDLYSIKYNENLDCWNSIIPLNNDNCLKCPALSICGGGCLLQTRTLFNEDSIDKAMCIFNKKVLEFILLQIYEIMRGGDNSVEG